MNCTFLILMLTCMVCAAQVSYRQSGRNIGHRSNEIFPNIRVFGGGQIKHFLNVKPNFEYLLKKILFATPTVEATTKTPETTQSSQETNETSVIPVHEFQIADLHGKKWISKDIGVHDNVTLSKEVSGSELWRLERKQNEALWSFHVLHEGKKLYLSYEDNSTDVTMELKDDSKGGKQRFFRILLQDMDIYRIQAQNNRDRYLINEDGKLEMFTQSDDDEEICSIVSAAKTERERHMLWVIKEDLSMKYYYPTNCEVGDMNRKWISGSPYTSQLVPLAQKSSLEKWKVTTSGPGRWIFSPVSGPPLYATITQSSPGKILFEGSLSQSNMREYKVFSCSGRHKLQSVSTGGWLAPYNNINPSHIVAVKDEKYSMGWYIDILTIPYQRNNVVLAFPSDL